MAWQTEIVQMLRVVINDLDTPETYSNSRLEQLISVSARFVVGEVDLDRTYTITIDAVTPVIDPDPTTLSTADVIFIDLITLKAACLMDTNTFRAQALVAGIKARCGPAVIETLGRSKAFKELIEVGPCAAYTQLKKEYEFGTSMTQKAILSPFIGNNFDPVWLDGGSRR